MWHDKKMADMAPAKAQVWRQMCGCISDSNTTKTVKSKEEEEEEEAAAMCNSLYKLTNILL